MFKKIFSVMILVAALIFIGNNQAEAREVYVGSYSDGSSVYLLTESVSGLQNVAGGVRFNCTVRAGRDYLNYSFYPVGSGVRNKKMMYKNSEGYSGAVFDGSSPVAAAIFNYVVNNY